MTEPPTNRSASPLDALAARALDDLARAGLLRTRVPADPATDRTASDARRTVNLASNDYLGLAGHPEITAAAHNALDRWGAGSTASPLVCGYRPCHAELEDRLAEFKGYPAALVFTSGYAANAGVFAALLGRDATVFADRLAHASLLDGIRLSGARLIRFRHNDPEHLRAALAAAPTSGTRMIVTESVFSMDGDLAPLSELADLADEYDAILMVDEAHATGLYGPAGAGRVSELELSGRVPICMGTLSKALGSAGGYIACSRPVREVLVNRARSYVYSTALPPAAAGAALGALRLLRDHPVWGRAVRARAESFRTELRAGGAPAGGLDSPIVPIPVGDPMRVMEVARRVREEGILVGAIRPPTVPAGTARLRASVSLAHDPADLQLAARVIAGALRENSSS
ncbi:MAG: 8-amino-7-oxononanoate synthase [Kiritimatiellae bacterium]|nr:8-amino-7-oxononanoate synthase [Kiritimatiellia bacterium]